MMKTEKNNQYLLLTFLLGVLLLSFMREPLFFTHPRIWAEEGVVHIQSVFNYGVAESLMKPHLGYFSLFNNYVMGFGLAIIGIDNIAYVTTISSYVAIFLSLLTPLILPSPYWRSRRSQFAIILFSLFIGTPEIWVNTINVQFYFGLFTCFLLLSDDKTLHGWRRLYVFFMLVNAAFTGITAVMLLPLFLWKYIKSKNISSAQIAVIAILSLGLLVQLASLIYLRTDIANTRFSMANLANFPYGVMQNFLTVIPQMGNAWRIAIAVAFLLMILILMKKKPAAPNYVWILIIAAYVSLVFAFLSLGMTGGRRYGYIPAVLIFIFLINLQVANERWLQTLKIGLIAILLSTSCVQFFQTRDFYNPAWLAFSLKNSYINSAGERAIKIFPQWPDTNWELVLPKGKYEKYQH